MKANKSLISCVILSLLSSMVLAQTVQYTYNDLGLVQTIDGPRIDVSDVTRFDYNSNGQLSRITNALGHKVEYQNYDAFGYPQKIINANGGQVTLTYDRLGNILTNTVHTRLGANKTTYTYIVGTSLVQSIKNSANFTLTYSYNNANQLTSINGSNRERIEFELDAAGNILSSKIKNTATNTLMYEHTRQYDELSRIIKDVGAANQTTQIAYDAEGNPLSLTDAKLNPTEQTFDALNRVKQLKDAKLGQTQYSYNGKDQITSVTDARGNTTSYEYDGLGQLLKTTSPDTGITQFVYDEAGNLTQKTDNKGNIVTYTFDALNRLLSAEFAAAPELNVNYSYDSTDDDNHGLGLLTLMTDSSGTTAYRYNQQGQVISETRNILGADYITSYQYDVNSALKQMIYPSGRSLSYQYDNQQRLIAITTQSAISSQAQPLINNLSYKPFGPIASLRYGNNLTNTYNYDLDYQLIDINSGIQQLSYAYDANGNIETINNTLFSRQSQQFNYDELNRLTQASGDYGSLNYAYDAVHNRTAKHALQVGQAPAEVSIDSYTYAADSNQLQQVSKSAPGITTQRDFSYDANGQIITDIDDTRALTLNYNAQNRLDTLTNNALPVAQYSYNALGQRVQKNVNGKVTHFHYDLNGQLIAETLADGTLLREYFFAGRQQIATAITNDNQGSTTTYVYYVHTDHLGTPTALTDSTGTVQWQAHYTPFGQTIVDIDKIKQAIRFPGQYYDEESGLHYNYFRDYDPELGRYIQSDPIGLAGGINTYGYAYQNPVMNTDPTGLWVPQAIGALVNMGYEGYTQYQSGNFNMGRLFVAGATGALGGFGSSAIKAIGFGSLAGATNSAYQEIDSVNMGCKDDIDSSKILRSAYLGGIGGGIGYGIGHVGKNIYKAPNTAIFDPAIKVSVNYGTYGSAAGAALGGIIGNQ
ncbi:YD repeat [Shewanella denitrificans OS217]|uniref:YD repeat n=2 Tax=Shewanella TaxID=22 RepID=Q12LF3_SHEDO|nr:YD repeat [Shewanella denitrificans OS217]